MLVDEGEIIDIKSVVDIEFDYSYNTEVTDDDGEGGIKFDYKFHEWTKEHLEIEVIFDETSIVSSGVKMDSCKLKVLRP